MRPHVSSSSACSSNADNTLVGTGVLGQCESDATDLGCCPQLAVLTSWSKHQRDHHPIILPPSPEAQRQETRATVRRIDDDDDADDDELCPFDLPHQSTVTLGSVDLLP